MNQRRLGRGAALLAVALAATIAPPQRATATPARSAQAPPVTVIDVPEGYRASWPNARGQILTNTPHGYVLWEPGRGETPIASPPVGVGPARLTEGGDVIGHYNYWIGIPGDPPLTLYRTRVPYLYTGGTWTRVTPWWTGIASATDANRAGQVLGTESPPSGVTVNVVWQDGRPTVAPASVREASELDDRGRVVGAIDPDGDGVTAAGIWQVGGSVAALPLPTGATSAKGREINEAGHVLGSFRTASGANRVALWRDGQAIDLGTLGGEHSGVDYADHLNDHDQVVGTSGTAPGDGNEHAFLWDDGVMIDLGTLGGARSFGRAVNDHAQVVGHSFPATGEHVHAFLWQDGEMYDLQELLPGAVYSVAHDISDNGLIYGRVGFRTDAGGIVEREVLWSAPAP